MDGTTVTAKGTPPNLGPSWDVEKTGDFNADGKDDILWRHHDDGRVMGSGDGRHDGREIARRGPAQP